MSTAPPSERTVGKPVVVGVLPAEVRPEPRLHRAGIVEQLDVAVGDDVGRHRERQHEQAVDEGAAGKRYMVTSQAVAVPTANASAPVPAASSSVRSSEPGSTVCRRCGQMLSAGVSASSSTVTAGSAMTARISATVTVHAGEARRRWRQAPMRRGRSRMSARASPSGGGETS